MSDFKPKRVTRIRQQQLIAAPEKVFPLLCPVREYDWIPHWKCDLVYTDSGFAEDNCIFNTRFPDDPADETWVVSNYQPAKIIQFIRFNGLWVMRYNIFLEKNSDNTTTATWEQIITTLNEEGNKLLEVYTNERYKVMIRDIEKMLNHYLETGEMLQKA